MFPAVGLFRECGSSIDQRLSARTARRTRSRHPRGRALLNNETYFFRDNAYFSVLANQVLPDLARKRHQQAAVDLVGRMLDRAGS